MSKLDMDFFKKIIKDNNKLEVIHIEAKMLSSLLKTPIPEIDPVTSIEEVRKGNIGILTIGDKKIKIKVINSNFRFEDFIFYYFNDEKEVFCRKISAI